MQTTMYPRTMNVLLLGETGVGKSTFINMFGNYLSGKSIREALRQSEVLVPTKFVLRDPSDLSEEVIEIGSSEHEIPGTGCSATQRPMTYTFNDPLRNLILNLIDTPGLADTRGSDRDDANCEAVLRFLAEFESIDAFCVLLRPDSVRITPQLEYCLKEILKQLDNSIVNNIVFIFTNCRVTRFGPGSTQICLKEMLGSIRRQSGARIPFGPDNYFCFDNEPLKFIVATIRGYSKFDTDDVAEYEDSYIKSQRAVHSMLDYFLTLNPAQLQGIATINESKRLIGRLVDPLYRLVVMYEGVLNKINSYKSELKDSETNIKLLKQNMYKIKYVPRTQVQPTGGGPSMNVSSGRGVFHWISLAVSVVTSVLEKIFRPAPPIEMHEVKELDTAVIASIKDNQSAKRAIQEKLEELDSLYRGYQMEIRNLLLAVATFAQFMDQHKLIADQDCFIKMWTAILKAPYIAADQRLSSQIRTYEEHYKQIKSELGNVNSLDVMNCVDDLYELPYSGELFRKIINTKIQLNRIVYENKM